jgi:hypothetical protein
MNETSNAAVIHMINQLLSRLDAVERKVDLFLRNQANLQNDMARAEQKIQEIRSSR